jgi:hypothetical protein
MSALERIPKKVARTVFCEKHQRYYQEGSSCYECFMAETHQDILRAILLNHEFVPACVACSCHWVAEFGGSESAYEKWVDHVTGIMKKAQP